jgi:hypothetical protein
VFIDSDTPALEQAMAFCTCHLLITPHSSQLANLVFSTRGISAVEVQADTGFIEPTFQNLAQKVVYVRTHIIMPDILYQFVVILATLIIRWGFTTSSSCIEIQLSAKVQILNLAKIAIQELTETPRFIFQASKLH